MACAAVSIPIPRQHEEQSSKKIAQATGLAEDVDGDTLDTTAVNGQIVLRKKNHLLDDSSGGKQDDEADGELTNVAEERISVEEGTEAKDIVLNAAFLRNVVTFDTTRHGSVGSKNHSRQPPDDNRLILGSRKSGDDNITIVRSLATSGHGQCRML